MGVYSVVGLHGFSEAESAIDIEFISLDNDVKVPECLHHMNTLPESLKYSDFGAGGTLYDKGWLKNIRTHNADHILSERLPCRKYSNSVHGKSNLRM